MVISGVVKLRGMIEGSWKDNFQHSRNSSCVNHDEDLDMLTDKGVYPYDDVNSWGRFNDTELFL